MPPYGDSNLYLLKLQPTTKVVQQSRKCLCGFTVLFTSLMFRPAMDRTTRDGTAFNHTEIGFSSFYLHEKFDYLLIQSRTVGGIGSSTVRYRKCSNKEFVQTIQPTKPTTF